MRARSRGAVAVRVSQTKARREVPESTHYKLAAVGAGIWLRCLTVLQRQVEHCSGSPEKSSSIYSKSLAARIDGGAMLWEVALKLEGRKKVM